MFILWKWQWNLPFEWMWAGLRTRSLFLSGLISYCDAYTCFTWTISNVNWSVLVKNSFPLDSKCMNQLSLLRLTPQILWTGSSKSDGSECSRYSIERRTEHPTQRVGLQRSDPKACCLADPQHSSGDSHAHTRGTGYVLKSGDSHAHTRGTGYVLKSGDSHAHTRGTGYALKSEKESFWVTWKFRHCCC
jgi:hypothetical protein